MPRYNPLRHRRRFDDDDFDDDFDDFERDDDFEDDFDDYGEDDFYTSEYDDDAYTGLSDDDDYEDDWRSTRSSTYPGYGYSSGGW